MAAPKLPRADLDLPAEPAERAALLEAVYDAIPDIIGLQDRRHRVLRYNAAGYRILATTPEDARGKHCYQLIGRDRVCEECATSEALRTGEPARIERHEPALDAWFDVRAYPVLGDDGAVAYIIEHLRDITERKRSEQREARQRADVAFLADTAMSFVELPAEADLAALIADRTAEIVGGDPVVAVSTLDHASGKFRPLAIRGIGAGAARIRELVGVELTELTTDFAEEVKARMATGRLQHVEGGVADLAEGVLPASVARAAAKLLGLGEVHVAGFVLGGEVLGGIALIQRIGDEPPRAGVIEALCRQSTVALQRRRAERERATLEEQFHQSQKLEAIGMLAGGVAHDFNNLLTGIFGNTALMQAHVDPQHPLQECLDEIEECARRATDLTQQLLAFGRRQMIQPRTIDLGDRLRRMHKMLGRLIGEDVRLVIEAADGVPPVRFDPTQLEQVLINLAVNARDAMPRGGTLTLSTGALEVDARSGSVLPPGTYARLTVRDTGHGMDASTLERVFEPFFTTKPRGRGTGLGLAMVHGAVLQNGGHVTADSAVGRGTRFTITLPAAPESAEDVPAPERARDLPRGDATVLLVEDDPIVREVTRLQLERLGYRVVAASSGEEALERVRAQASSFDVLITDLIMPGINGEELSRRVRELAPGLPTLFVSGYPRDVLEHRGARVEDVHLLTKPFDERQLAVRLAEILAVD